MTAFRFDCIFYYVRDLDRAIQFYTTILGFEMSSRDAVARFHIDGVLFELVPTDDDALLTGRGNGRLTLSVTSLSEVVQKLHAAGVRATGVRSVANGQLSSLYDPDGNEIILWQAG